MKISGITEKIKQVRSDIKELKTVKELFMYISYDFLSALAFIFLILLILSPIYILIRSVFLEHHMSFDMYVNRVQLSSTWYTLLQQIGYVGIIIGVMAFIKSVIAYEGTFFTYVKQHLFPILLFLFIVWGVFSCLFSGNISLSFNGSEYRKEGLHTYLIYAGIFSMGYVLNRKKYLMHLFRIFVSVSLILSVLMLINKDYLNRLFTLQLNSAVFYNSNHFAYYLCMAIMMNFCLVFNARKVIHKGIWLCTFSVLLSTLIKNNSFGPYLAVFITLIVVLIISLLFNRKAFITYLIVLIVFSSVSFGYNMRKSFITLETGKMSEGIKDIVENNEQAPKAGSGRWRLWSHAFKYALEKPIFGYGLDNLEQRYLEDNIDMDRPHNEFIQYAATLGFPAVLLYIAALLVMLRNINPKDTYSLNLYAVVLAYLISSFFGNSMFYTTPFFVLILSTAFNKTAQSKVISEP